MIYALLADTERGDILIMADSAVTIRNWVDDQFPDMGGLKIFRPHQERDVSDYVARPNLWEPPAEPVTKVTKCPFCRNPMGEDHRHFGRLMN